MFEIVLRSDDKTLGSTKFTRKLGLHAESNALGAYKDYMEGGVERISKEAHLIEN